jgi:ubiquinone/menaquinone biosynthesis C-methylase UbiE
MIQEPLLREAASLGAPRGRCLNAGCGEGIFAPFLESYSAVTEIVNIDIAMPQIGSHRADDRHTDLVGSVDALPLDDASVDYVLCTEVLEHVEDDDGAAHELSRVLRPGGTAVISVPVPPAPHDPNHVREGYSLDALSQLLQDADLQVLWHRYCFHLLMRWLLVLWRWQYEHLGRERRTLMPSLMVKGFGAADRALAIGRPWDLILVAQKGEAPATG